MFFLVTLRCVTRENTHSLVSDWKLSHRVVE